MLIVLMKLVYLFTLFAALVSVSVAAPAPNKTVHLTKLADKGLSVWGQDLVYCPSNAQFADNVDRLFKTKICIPSTVAIPLGARDSQSRLLVCLGQIWDQPDHLGPLAVLPRSRKHPRFSASTPLPLIVSNEFLTPRVS